MKRSSDRERDAPFGQTMLRLRTALGLTRVELADLLGVSRQAVEQWERGRSYPKVDSLKQIIVLGMKRRIFLAGCEDKEIRVLWQAAHQKALLDEHWLQALLGQQRPPLSLCAPPLVEGTSPDDHAIPQLALGPQVDWGEALAVTSFYGREQELAQLTRWVVQEHSRVVSVLGMGGIGKSALAVSLMRQLASHFEVVVFRSLRDAPMCKVLLDDCLQVLSPHPLGIVPSDLDQRFSLLLKHLQQFRALVVLDNLEALLEEGSVKGRFRPGYEDYGRLLRQVGETTHQSCLLLTSREKPAEVELRRLEGKSSPVRSLRLSGLATAECQQLFAEKGLIGTPQDQARLAEVYAGNPLALKIVAETISQRFAGQIAPFLSQDLVIFGNISNLLDEQFARLSPLEQTVLCWLAIVREPVTLDELRAVLVSSPPHMQLLEAIESLHRRSLLERGQRSATFTLQAVVLEYVTAVLVKQATDELQQHQLKSLIPYGLEQASAREYVRQTQERLLLTPIIENLRQAYQEPLEVEEVLLSQFDQLRQRATHAQGYGPANLIALLRLQQGHLRGLDLSHLTIRDAYLQGIEMQGASLVGATIRDTVFTEALDAIWSVAISRTGQYWAVGTWRGEVRVWREEGQQLHLAWQAHSDNTLTLAFSPDERLLATGSWDGAVKLWDLQRGALLWANWHTDLITSVTFAPDGCTLASGGNDAKIHLWGVPSGKQVQALTSPGGAIHSLAWSADGSLLASGCFDSSIQLWHMQESRSAICTKTLVGHSHWIMGLAFAPDGKTLASTSWDHTVKLWEMPSGRLLQTLSGHTERVYRVAWSPDEGTLASCSMDKTIRFWDVKQGSCRAVLHGHRATVYSLAFTPDSNTLVSGSEDSTLRIWDVTDGQRLRTIEGYTVSLYDLAWSPDGHLLASAGSDGQVTLWETADKLSFRKWRGHNWMASGVAWSPDGQVLASSGWDNTIRLWEPTTGKSLQVLCNPDHSDTVFHGIAWSPDGRLLVSGTYMYGLQMWDMATCTRCWIEETHQTTLRHIAWNPDGVHIAGGGDDGYAYIWNAVDGTLQLLQSGHQGMVANVAWSPDGRLLASVGGGREGGELVVWNMQSGERVRDFVGHLGIVWAVTWGPSNDQLISGDSDGILRRWNAQSGQCVHAQAAHQGTIRSLKVSPDGNILASCSVDGTIKLWDLHSRECLQTLRYERPYERLDMTGIRGLTEARKSTLRSLGAIEEDTSE